MTVQFSKFKLLQAFVIWLKKIPIIICKIWSLEPISDQINFYVTRFSLVWFLIKTHDCLTLSPGDIVILCMKMTVDAWFLSYANSMLNIGQTQSLYKNRIFKMKIVSFGKDTHALATDYQTLVKQHIFFFKSITERINWNSLVFTI